MAEKPRKAFAALLAFVLAFLLMAPTAALAEERAVDIENHTAVQDQKATVNDIRIGGVHAPAAGTQLDGEARVATAEGEEWDIPVLWVRDDLAIMPEAAEADEGRTYLPVLAFFVPDGYALQGPDCKVTLSEELAALFGTDEIVSAYSEETGITYILPASLKSLFVRAAGELSTADDAGGDAAVDAAETAQPTLVDIHCAQTARDVLTDEDLAWLVDLIVNRLEPQAVNLLLDRFPAFRAAADKGEIGTQIGLYIYYAKGDADGDPAHEIDVEGALAYVDDRSAMIDGTLRYAYMIGVNAASLAEKGDDGSPLVNPATGRYNLVRSGHDFETFVNTIVHEMFHAFMDDYNRLGMFGTVGLADRETDAAGDWKNPRTAAECAATRFPLWFIEGSASAMENNYQFRNRLFTLLCKDSTGETSADNILNNYQNATIGDDPAYFDLGFSNGVDADGNKVDGTTANYVSGYLAVLYLSDLANMRVNGGGSAVSPTGDGGFTISNKKLCSGLNQILEWLHADDTTLDDVINFVSPSDANGKLYHNTEAFTNKFIKGTSSGGSSDVYTGDEASLTFVANYLDCLWSYEGATFVTPNGSILFDYDADFTMPLDPDKKDSADLFKIVGSNTYVKSSVSSNTGAIGGGTSYSSDNPWSDQIAQEASTPAAASAPAAAAKQGAAEERFDEEDPEEDPCEPFSSENPQSGQVAQETSDPAAASAPAAAAKQDAAEKRVEETDSEEDPCEPFSSDNPQPDQAAQEATNRDGCFSSSGTLDDALPDPAELAKQDASNDE